MGLRGRDQNRIFLDVGGESSSDGYQRVEEGSGGGGGENEEKNYKHDMWWKKIERE